MHGDALGFLDSFVQDEVRCRCLTEEMFGAPLDNEENDVPLYDQYNRGLVACQEDRPRRSLELEGARPGMTGYIPSMEEGMEAGASPRPKTLVLALGGPKEEMLEQSRKRRGLSR
jgi:hypothetical protein